MAHLAHDLGLEVDPGASLSKDCLVSFLGKVPDPDAESVVYLPTIWMILMANVGKYTIREASGRLGIPDEWRPQMLRVACDFRDDTDPRLFQPTICSNVLL